MLNTTHTLTLIHNERQLVIDILRAAVAITRKLGEDTQVTILRKSVQAVENAPAGNLHLDLHRNHMMWIYLAIPNVYRLVPKSQDNPEHRMFQAFITKLATFGETEGLLTPLGIKALKNVTGLDDSLPNARNLPLTELFIGMD